MPNLNASWIVRNVMVVAASFAAVAIPTQLAAQPAAVSTPTVTAAPSTGEMWLQSSFDVARHGLVEQEFFFEGTTSAGVPYKSRMIVRRPINPRRFNGTVVVEWMNASTGADLDMSYLSLLPLMEREGYAYVGVTAQQNTVAFLRNRNAARYGTLKLMDDQPQSAAFEVFSQAGQALKANGRGVDPLGGLRAKVLIATGQSQSSGRLGTFINTVHGLKLAPVYDAVVLLAGGGAPTRFPIPVLKLNSESEVPGYYGSRAVAHPNYTYWEVPGTAHQPFEGTEHTLAKLTITRPGVPRCQFPYAGTGGPVPIDPVWRAGIWHLDQAVRTGKPLPKAPLIEMDPPKTGNLGVIRRDRFGNALGGIRLPQQEVPTGRNTPSTGCKVTFEGNQLTMAAYPQWDAFDGGKDPVVDPADTVNATEPASAKAVYGSHANYVARFGKATDAVRKQGLILKLDADRMKREAAASNVAR